MTTRNWDDGTYDGDLYDGLPNEVNGVVVNGREPDLVSEVESMMTTGYLFNKKRTRASRHVGRSRQRERY